MDAIIAQVTALPSPLIWLILGFSAGAEYVFPPFPGDVIVISGGLLAGTSQLSYVPIFLFVTGGSVLGAWLDFEVGRWLNREDRNTFLHRWTRRPRVRRRLDELARGFTRHGDLYLIVNRFLPGVRGFFFVAAGLSELSRLRTLVLATVAAALWNVLLIAVGLAVGANLEALLSFLKTYSQIAWALVLVVGGLLVWRWLRPGRDPQSR